MFESILTETAEIERQLGLAKLQTPDRPIPERRTRRRLATALRPRLPRPALRPTGANPHLSARTMLPWAGPGGNILP